jgi:hypothetical protein
MALSCFHHWLLTGLSQAITCSHWLSGTADDKCEVRSKVGFMLWLKYNRSSWSQFKGRMNLGPPLCTYIHTLWLMVNSPVYLSFKHHLGPKTRFLFLSGSCKCVDVRHPSVAPTIIASWTTANTIHSSSSVIAGHCIAIGHLFIEPLQYNRHCLNSHVTIF